MRKMLFENPMPDVTRYILPDGDTDILVLANGRMVETEDENGENGKRTMYEYDGNMFRTQKIITGEQIAKQINFYLNYEGETQPTEKMKKYAEEQIDAYTMQLLEEGILR